MHKLYIFPYPHAYLKKKMENLKHFPETNHKILCRFFGVRTSSYMEKITLTVCV